MREKREERDRDGEEKQMEEKTEGEIREPLRSGQGKD